MSRVLLPVLVAVAALLTAPAHSAEPSSGGLAPDLPGPGPDLAPEAPARAPGDSAFALNLSMSGMNEFVTHPVETFVGATELGTNEDLIVGIDFDEQGEVLYAINQTTSELGTLDPADGTFTAIGTLLRDPDHDFWGGFTVDPFDGTLYATSFDNTDLTDSTLYTLDPTDASSAVLGTNDLALLATLAMDCAGDLYGIDLVTDELYSVDSDTGDATSIGSLGIDANFAQEMDFDADTGILYAWLREGVDPFPDFYGTIDTATGTFTPIDEIGTSAQYVGATRTSCLDLFADGFESGDISAWATP